MRFSVGTTLVVVVRGGIMTCNWRIQNNMRIIFWKVVLSLLLLFHDCLHIDHGLADFGGYPKSFLTLPWKTCAGTRRWQRALWFMGPSQSCARVRIFNLRPLCSIHRPPRSLPTVTTTRRDGGQSGGGGISLVNVHSPLAYLRPQSSTPTITPLPSNPSSCCY